MSGNKNSKPEEIDNTKLSPSLYPSLANLLQEYLAKIPKEDYPVFAVFGIPGPVKNNAVLHITNIPKWPKFNGDELAKLFNIKKFVLLNDFTCNAYGVQTDLKLGEDYIVINDAKPEEDGPKLIVGPGTGLGMGYLVKDQDNEFYAIGASEGGHQDYTAKTKDNYALREYFKKTLGNTELSIERVLSGQGLIIIYKYLKEHGAKEQRDKELEEKIKNFDDLPTSPAANEINIELVNKGMQGKCELSKKVLEYFIGIFGDVSGDVSLFSVPTGGLYLVGGLSIVLEPLISGTNIFMEHYLKKDDFAYLLKTFPIYLVKNGNLGMLGAQECARRLLLE